MLQPLVGQSEHNGVGGGDSQLGATRRQGHQHARSQEEEENSGRQDIAPHFCLTNAKKSKSPLDKVHRCECHPDTAY